MENKIFYPFGRNIWIEPVVKKQVLVSDTALRTEYGKVIAIGEEVKHIKCGEVVGFLIWGVNSLEIGDRKIYIVPEDDQFILGRIDESLLLE